MSIPIPHVVVDELIKKELVGDVVESCKVSDCCGDDVGNAGEVSIECSKAC
jgi:hypothetical protein